MGSLGGFLLVYFLGGLTFIPLLFTLIVLHAYLTLPSPGQSTCDGDGERTTGTLERPGDDQQSFITDAHILEEKFQRSYESDVAAGYFTVCREYTPSWFYGKSLGRPLTAGESTAVESASVYQAMYSTLFNRNQSSTLKREKTTGKTEKRVNNLFFIVLR